MEEPPAGPDHTPIPLRELTMRERGALAWDNTSVRWSVIGLVVVVMVVGYLAWHSRPTESAAPPQIVRAGQSPPSTGSPGAARDSSPGEGQAAPAASTTVVVDVVGPVRHPGVVSLPAGSRVGDAIMAAGGLKRGTTDINLARVLVDGEQIDVSVPSGAAPVGGGAGGSGSGSAGSAGATGATGAKVSINRATAAELEALPRVGPVMAAKIIDFRTQNGGFRSIDQLKEVPGIGEVTFAGLAPHVVL